MTTPMDRLLRDALASRSPDPAPEGCLDAETAAAFADDTLSIAERRPVEAHVADCARCQALLSVLERTAPEPVATPAWWRRPAFAWLTSAAVAAVAIVLWISTPPAANKTAREAAPMAKDDASRVEPSTPPARDADPRTAAVSPPVPSREHEQTLEKREAPPAAPVDARADRHTVAPPAASNATVPDSAGPAEAPPPASSMLEASKAQDAAASGSRRLAQEPQAPQAAAAARQEEDAKKLAAAPSLARSRVVPNATIVSSDSRSQWRIAPGSVVQRSPDGGTTWQTQATGANVALTAGASPSPLVCWLVGPGGVVLLSTDEGRSWQRLPFPEATALASVRATDARTASVTTGDGRTFRTADGGQSWER